MDIIGGQGSVSSWAVSYMLMRLRSYKVSGASLDDFKAMVAHAYKDLENIPSFGFRGNPLDPMVFYQENMNQNIEYNLLLRKFICDLNPSIDFRHIDPTDEGEEHPKLKSEPWYEFPSSYEVIAGYKFLKCQDDYLVTSNGGLVAIGVAKIAIEKFLRAGYHLAELKFLNKAIEKYLFEPTELVDGVDCCTYSSPICLDVDYLTGLYLGDELNEFKRDNPDWHNLRVGQKNEVFEKAATRVKAILGYLTGCVDDIFKGIDSSNNPYFFMSLGGVGSGKTKLEEFIDGKVDGKKVGFSVDNARTKSQIYKLLIEANHHSDDYLVLKEFAYLLFDKVVNRALQNKINFFHDSSGIPFIGKNDKVVQAFKLAGFKTFCLVAAAAIYVRRGRESDLNQPVHQRIIARFENKRRAVPWPITLSKHINHPIAQADALLDANLDCMIVFDTMQEKGYTKVIAEAHILSINDSNELSKAKDTLVEIDRLGLAEFINHEAIEFPGFDIKYLVVNNNQRRALIMIDKIRYLDIVQKSLFNMGANGYDELVLNTFRWHIPHIDFPGYEGEENDFILRMQ